MRNVLRVIIKFSYKLIIRTEVELPSVRSRRIPCPPQLVKQLPADRWIALWACFAVNYRNEVRSYPQVNTVIVKGKTIEPRAMLSWARLRRTALAGCNLQQAILQGADLRQADLHGSNLSGARLSHAYLQGANLAGANLEYADLRGADLTGAQLKGASLVCARLEGAIIALDQLGSVSSLAGATLPDGSKQSR